MPINHSVPHSFPLPGMSCASLNSALPHYHPWVRPSPSRAMVAVRAAAASRKAPDVDLDKEAHKVFDEVVIAVK